MDLCVVPFNVEAYTGLARSSCKIKEYLAMNKPIVTSAIGENMKDLDNGNYGILVKNDSELAKGIKFFIDNKDAYKAIDYRKHAKIYDINALSNKLNDLLKDN